MKNWKDAVIVCLLFIMTGMGMKMYIDFSGPKSLGNQEFIDVFVADMLPQLRAQERVTMELASQHLWLYSTLDNLLTEPVSTTKAYLVPPLHEKRMPWAGIVPDEELKNLAATIGHNALVNKQRLEQSRKKIENLYDRIQKLEPVPVDPPPETAIDSETKDN